MIADLNLGVVFALVLILPSITKLILILGIEPGTSGILDKLSTTQLYAILEYIVLHLNLSYSTNHSYFLFPSNFNLFF